MDDFLSILWRFSLLIYILAFSSFLIAAVIHHFTKEKFGSVVELFYRFTLFVNLLAVVFGLSYWLARLLY